MPPILAIVYMAGVNTWPALALLAGEVNGTLSGKRR
jgi:hypothetical protein